MTGEADRTVIGEAEAFQQHHPAAATDAEAGGDALVGRKFAELADDAGGFFVMFSYPFREAGARFDVVVEYVFGDE